MWDIWIFLPITDCLSPGEILSSLHYKAKTTKQLLQVHHVQPRAGPGRVELGPEEGIIVDQ